MTSERCCTLTMFWVDKRTSIGIGVATGRQPEAAELMVLHKPKDDLDMLRVAWSAVMRCGGARVVV